MGIGTTATDKADGDKLVTGADITIVDEVAYEGLVPASSARSSRAVDARPAIP